MTWENLRRILGLPGKTSAHPFSPTSNPAWNCSQEWGGEGLGRLKMKHGEWVGLSMVPKDRVGRVVTMAADSPWKYAMKHAVFLTGLTSEGPSCKKTSSRYEI